MCSGLSVANIFMAKVSDIYIVSRHQKKLTKGFVGVPILCEDPDVQAMVIPQFGIGSSSSTSTNVRFDSRIDWRNKHNIG